MADLARLDKAIKELEIQSDELKDFSKIHSEIDKLKDGISDNLSLLMDHNDTLSKITKEFGSALKDSNRQLERLKNMLVNEVELLRQDNKNFQKELDSSLITRLDKHKSDIEVTVRNEGAQIQRAIETTLNLNFNSMESKLRELFNAQSRQLNTLKKLIMVLIGIVILLATGLYFK